MQQSTKILFLAIIMSTPVAISIIDFRSAVELADCVLIALSINHRESHLTVGSYLIFLYLVLYLPTIALTLEALGLRKIASRNSRAIIHTTLTLYSLLSIYMYFNGYSLI